MMKVQGTEITVVVEDLENYAKCVLHYINLKCSRGTVTDVKTVEGTDLIVVIGEKSNESFLKGIAEEYGKIIDVSDKMIIEIEDEDIEQIPVVAREFNDWYESDMLDELYVVGKFDNR